MRNFVSPALLLIVKIPRTTAPAARPVKEEHQLDTDPVARPHAMASPSLPVK